MIFDIVHGESGSRAKVISCTKLVNFYPEIEKSETSKFTKALIGCPGYRKAVEASQYGTCRAIYTTSTGRLFTIISDKLIEISTGETATMRGTVLTTADRCIMCDNGAQIMITDGLYGYIYTLAADVLTRITDTDFPEFPTHCIFTDGYFLATSRGSGKFYFSASYDGTAWASLDFATAEYSADTLAGIVKTSNGTIWMIGKLSLELWSNVNTANLPWRRTSGTVKEVGCISPYSIASNGRQAFWLGSGINGYGAVFMGAGYDIMRISTPAIEYQIKKLSRSQIENADAFVYSDETHSFYIINFSGDKTFAYDAATGEWHQRGSMVAATGYNGRQFADGAAYFNGKTYVGSYVNGNIYEMSLDIYDEDGQEIKREIITNHISVENRLLRHTRLEIDCEKGVGVIGGGAPVIMMRFSNDGGHTWSNQCDKTAGAIGEYSTRAIYRMLGTARDRVYEIVVSDPVKWVITLAYVETGA